MAEEVKVAGEEFGVEGAAPVDGDTVLILGAAGPTEDQAVGGVFSEVLVFVFHVTGEGGDVEVVGAGLGGELGEGVETVRGVGDGDGDARRCDSDGA